MAQFIQNESFDVWVTNNRNQTTDTKSRYTVEVLNADKEELIERFTDMPEEKALSIAFAMVVKYNLESYTHTETIKIRSKVI